MGGDDALYTRLTEDCTFALVDGGHDDRQIEELGVSRGRHFSTKNVGLIYAAKRADANGDNVLKDTLLGLASRSNDPNLAPTFEDKFKISVSNFREKVAGWQTARVRKYLPLRPSPAPAPVPAASPQAPEAMDILDTRHQRVKQYLDENPSASLLFADETSNSQERFSSYYDWLRGQLSAKQHRATMAEIIKITTDSTLDTSVYLYDNESANYGIKLRIASWVAPCREPSGKIQEAGCIRIINRVAFDEWLKTQPPQSPLGKRTASPSTTGEGRPSAKKIRGSHGDATSPVAEDEEDDGPPHVATYLRKHPSTELAFTAEESTQRNERHVAYYAYLREKIQRREYVLGLEAPVATMTEIITLTNQWKDKEEIRRHSEADKDFNKYVIPAVVAGWILPKTPLVKIKSGNEFCTWLQFQYKCEREENETRAPAADT